jgi:hypothetical protein
MQQFILLNLWHYHYMVEIMIIHIQLVSDTITAMQWNVYSILNSFSVPYCESRLKSVSVIAKLYNKVSFIFY